MRRALVLFSGGQDSTVCLAYAITHFDYVETIGFDYRQRHIVEMECRQNILQSMKNIYPHWAKKLGPDHVVDAGVLGAISETALTREMDIQLNEKGLPSTFVPGRNLLFFTLAAAVAYRTQCYHLVGGMCETDYSGYPDCRDNTLQSMQQTLRLGVDAPFEIHTPLMHIDKAATWNLAQQLGGQPLLDLIINETHTCYKGERGQRHDWGYGCGECPACTLRQKGFVQFCS